MYRERPLLGIALISREVKNACGVFLLSIRSRFLRGELRTPCSLQVARGTSHDARQGCRVALSHNICAFYAAKCGSERYKDVTRTDTARNSLMKSEVEKRLRRFSFIRAEAFIPHPFGCNKRYESRLQFLMRTRSATFTACCVIGYAKKSCAGNFALRARCKSRTARIWLMKSRVEKRLARFSFIGDASKSCALLGFALISRKAKNGRAVFLLLTRSRFLRTARNSLMKSEVEKRLRRFSFIGYAKKSCALLGFFRSCLNSLNHIKSKMYF